MKCRGSPEAIHRKFGSLPDRLAGCQPVEAMHPCFALDGKMPPLL
jgi:hypothetical protein